MGTRTDEAERRLREQRARIEHKLDTLEQRAEGDVNAARARITERLAHLPEAVPGATMLMEEVTKRPFTTLAGAAGAGVALGLLSEGFAGGEHEQRSGSRRGRRGDHHDGNGGLSARAFSALGASLLTPLQSQIEDLAREAVAGFSERARSRGDAPRAVTQEGQNGGGSRVA